MTAAAFELQAGVGRLAFDSLFLSVLRPTGEFAEELAEAGFDPAERSAELPLEVFTNCLEIARRRIHPDLTPDAAFQQLGRALAVGVFQQPRWTLLGLTLPMFGPERCLASPCCWSWLETLGVERVAVAVGPNRWRLELTFPEALPAELLAGAVAGTVERTGVGARVSISEISLTGCTLRVRW